MKFLFIVLCSLALHPFHSSAFPSKGDVRSIKDDKLDIVIDSGVCETTPNVHQASGYIEVGTNMSMWFWFFEARNNPDTAPLTLWLNGGPGCSSMIGLFQEHGPCSVDSDGTAQLNPNSWNEISNMIYVDEPIGAGFSYGDVTVDSTQAAAPFVWEFFQVFFQSDEFSKYYGREFILATESYGGHYGPAFVTYFNEQNALINAGQLDDLKVPVSALMINNGWYDPPIHNHAFVKFAWDAPGYGPLQNSTTLLNLTKNYYEAGGCKDKMDACAAFNNTDSAGNDICADADAFCIANVEGPSSFGRYEYDLMQDADSPNLFSYGYYKTFLNNSDILKQIGAKAPYAECSDENSKLSQGFNATGDDGRSWLPELAALVDSGMRVLIWAGDRDINCNWVGGYDAVRAMKWYGAEELASAQLVEMTYYGEPAGEIVNVDNFTFARIFDAGHEVMAYKPELSLEILSQIIKMEPLHSVPSEMDEASVDGGAQALLVQGA